MTGELSRLVRHAPPSTAISSIDTKAKRFTLRDSLESPFRLIELEEARGIFAHWHSSRFFRTVAVDLAFFFILANGRASACSQVLCLSGSFDSAREIE